MSEKDRTIKLGEYEFHFHWLSNSREWNVDVTKKPVSMFTFEVEMGTYPRGQGEAIMTLLNVVVSKFAAPRDTQLRNQSQGAS